MEKKVEMPRVQSIPPTNFEPLKKIEKHTPEKSVQKKKYLDELYSKEWKNNYFMQDS